MIPGSILSYHLGSAWGTKGGVGDYISKARTLSLLPSSWNLIGLLGGGSKEYLACQGLLLVGVGSPYGMLEIEYGLTVHSKCPTHCTFDMTSLTFFFCYFCLFILESLPAALRVTLAL